MSSTDASKEEHVSEKYLSDFNRRESDIIRSVVASVLAGEVSRDAIAEAVQRASEALQTETTHHADAGAESSLPTESLDGCSGLEHGHEYDVWANVDNANPALISDIDVDGHDRETQRLLTNEKILQDDLRNMGLMNEGVPTFDETPNLTCSAVHGDLVNVSEHTFQEYVRHSDVSDHVRQQIPDPAPCLHRPLSQPVHQTSQQTAQGYGGRPSRTARSPVPNSHKVCQVRPLVRPQSAGPVQRPQQRSSRPGSSKSPLPRVAFLGNAKCQPDGHQQRQHFPLVGGLQSELDNNEAYSILGTTLKRAGCIEPGHEQDVYVRQVAWRARVHAKAEGMRQELLTEEVSQSVATQKQRKCASHPLCDLRMQQRGSIESLHTMLPANASGPQSEGADGGGHNIAVQTPAFKAGSTLYDRGRQQAQRLDDKRKAAQVEQEKEWRQRPARRLSPQIYPQGCLLGTAGKPVARENMRAWEHMWDPDVNPTFRPTTNFGTRMRDTRRRAKSLGATSGRSAAPIRAPVQSRSHVPCSDELDFREFLERQDLHGARRTARVEQSHRDVHQSLARTVPMAPGTRRLLLKKQSTTSNCAHSLSLEGMVEPYEDGPPETYTKGYACGHSVTRRLEYAKESEVENCTFRPRIRPSSHFRTGRTVEDLSVGDSASRAAKIQEGRRQKEQMIKQETPFKPQLYSPARSVAAVKSKLARDSDYLQLCKDKEVRKEQKRQAHQARQQAAEMRECTFRPRTGRMPKLIQDMISAA